MKLLPADIIITTDKKSLFSALILKAMRTFQRDEVNYQHAILIVDDEKCIEALTEVKYNDIEKRLKDFKRYKIIRCSLLTGERKEAVVKAAEKFLGKKYSYFRIFLQLLDHIFNTDRFTGKYKDEDDHICSSLLAWAYQKETGLKFNGINWRSCEPDDIDDASLKNPNVWDTILEWEKD